LVPYAYRLLFFFFCVFIYFFLCVVQSFPTRRSSDLHSVILPAQRRGESEERAILAHVIFVEAQIVDAGPGCNLRAPILRLADGRDRKSTRLNSSHVKISYAVFCLKKKIE